MHPATLSPSLCCPRCLQRSLQQRIAATFRLLAAHCPSVAALPTCRRTDAVAPAGAMRSAIHALRSRARLGLGWLNIPSPQARSASSAVSTTPGRRHGSPAPRVLPGGLLRGAAALADPERADGAGCAAHGGARHEAPGLLPEGLAVRGRPAKAVRVQVGRCRDAPILDRAVSSRWLPASVALRISHGRTEQLSFPRAGRPHRLPPHLSSRPVPLSARLFGQVVGRCPGTASLLHFTRHGCGATHTRAPKNPRAAHVPCFRSLALESTSIPRVERSHAGRVVCAGRTRTSTRRSSTTARASSSAPPPPRRRAWTPPPPTVHHAPSPCALTPYALTITLEHEPCPEP